MDETAGQARRIMLRDAPAFGFAALVVGALCFVPTIFSDPDTYWHIATGEWILRHHVVPTADPFSWSLTGRLWTAHEWLVDVVLALGFNLAGWGGVAVLTALAAGGLFALLGRYLLGGLPLRATLIFLIFVAFGAAPSLLARPHLFALPILAGWTIGLFEARAARRAPSLWLLPLMLLWANLHASFVLGLALIGPLALEALAESTEGRAKAFWRWSLFGAAALLLTLLNPQGVQGLLYPFQVVNMAALPLILEWQSARFDTITPFQAVLFEGLFFLLWLGVRVPPLRLLVLLGMLYLALHHVRQQIVFVVMATLLLRDPLAQGLKARFPGETRDLGFGARRVIGFCSAAGVLAVALLRLGLPLERSDDTITPQSALAAVPAPLRQQRVLNGYNFGGYLIFKGIPTFIDGRSDMVGDAFVAEYFALKTAPVDKIGRALDTNRIDWTLLEPTDPLVRNLDRIEGWRRIYSDRFAVVHARSSTTAGR